MSSEISIKVENLSKCYQIYEQPRDRLKQFIVPRLQSAIGQPSKQYFREFWALKDVSFEVKKGETVGIIGRNGAGKSTLLQILCGTLTPTNGNVEIKGRVAALLELGSGFNPDFTGRENVYMNATVLGLRKEEIDARFDDIVAFADIGEFLDQPVKMYSSGMYVRLAFAVVVHVDADILIVDEALSVGDMYFQAKCMAHMKKLMNSGVTVLFVSHDISAVKALCSRAVYLEHGNVIALGSAEAVVEAYYGAGVKSAQSIQTLAEPEVSKLPNGFSAIETSEQKAFEMRAAFHRIQNGMADFLDVRLLDTLGRKVEVVDFGQVVVLRMVIKANLDLHCVGLAYHIRNKNGVDVIYSDTGIERCHISNLRIGEVVTMDWEFTAHLQQGDYSVAAMLSIPQDLSIGQVEVCDFVPLAVNFQVAVGKCLPIYGAAYWANKISQQRHAVSGMSEK
jgi:lipopolysaccharide transport system ATP-binding protein